MTLDYDSCAIIYDASIINRYTINSAETNYVASFVIAPL